MARANMSDETSLDDIDLQLVTMLREDARLSARELARRVGMSPGAIGERIARLEATGVIRGYHAAVNEAALGYPLRIIIGIQVEQGPPLSEFIDALLLIPEIDELHMVAGQWDLVLTARIRDPEHLRDVIMNQLFGTVGFRHSETMLILETYQAGIHNQPGAEQVKAKATTKAPLPKRG